MNKNSTPAGKCIIMLTILTLLLNYSVKAQAIPQLKFCQPQLIAGADGQVGATYKFANVIPNVDAYIKIEELVNGAILRNIDDSTLGYYNAWQPTVGGPGTYGSSYIKWDISFDSANVPYVFPTLAASAIDVDGDNERVREFIGVNGESSYSLPVEIPSLLTVSTVKDTDNISGTDANDTNLIALGPVANRTGIDTLSQDVRINFNFTNTSDFKIYTGSEVDSNGTTGGIATDRYHCIYFQNIVGTTGVLPVTYQSFNAVLNNNAVNLNWTTSMEISNDHFEVERSFDEVNFSTIAFVLGAQSEKNGANQYSFTDKDNRIANQNIIYYRLKQVDVDGNFTYSVIKTVRVNNMSSEPIAIKVMPNPYMDKLNVNFTSNNSGKAEIRMISASGTVVKKIESTITKGSNTFQLQDLSSQLPGMYVINIVVNGQSIGSQKIIKN
jgi:Secretion system C-terminal sorting domain